MEYFIRVYAVAGLVLFIVLYTGLLARGHGAVTAFIAALFASVFWPITIVEAMFIKDGKR